MNDHSFLFPTLNERSFIFIFAPEIDAVPHRIQDAPSPPKEIPYVDDLAWLFVPYVDDLANVSAVHRTTSRLL